MNALNTFQVVILIVVPCLALASVLAALRRWLTKTECLVWTAVCLAACVATAWPQSTQRLARALGIGRGADLVLYCAVVVMMIGFWMVYIRLRYLRRELTLLVRRLALLDAQRRESGETRPNPR